MIRPGAAGR